MAHHADDGFLVEELHAFASQLGDVDQRLGVWILVNQRVGNIQGAASGINDVHGSEVLVLRTDADDLLDHLDGIGILGVETSNEGVGLASLDHHHAEVVALEHLVVGFLEGVALTLALLGQDVGVALTAFLLRGVAQVDNLYAVDVQIERLGELGDDLVVAQQDGVADALGVSLHSGFEHGGVDGFGKDHTLGVSSSGGVELLGEFGLLTQQDGQRPLVLVPILDGLAGHTTVDGCLGDSSRNLRDEAWVNRLGNEIVASEVQVVNLIDVVHHIGHGLLGQVGNGVHGSQLHLFVDGGGMNVQGSAEDVGEANDVVDLVGIVRATG